MGREIPIIADPWVSPEFGTGAVKITPAHDPNDYAVGQRHKLPSINIMDETAHLNEIAGPFAGLDRFEARKRIVADLEGQPGLLASRSTPTPSASATAARPWSSRACRRSGSSRFSRSRKRPSPRSTRATSASRPSSTARPTTSGCATSTTGASRASSGGAIAFPRGTAPPATRSRSPARPRKHASIATRRRSRRKPMCSTPGSPPACCPSRYSAGRTRQPDLAAFYPTELLVTGFDILFFWVARMIMFGCHFMLDVPMPDGSPRTLKDAVPFREVYIHALVRDAERAEDVEDQGQRHRPHRNRQALRHRCCPLHSGDDGLARAQTSRSPKPAPRAIAPSPTRSGTPHAFSSCSASASSPEAAG